MRFIRNCWLILRESLLHPCTESTIDRRTGKVTRKGQPDTLEMLEMLAKKYGAVALYIWRLECQLSVRRGESSGMKDAPEIIYQGGKAAKFMSRDEALTLLGKEGRDE